MLGAALLAVWHFVTVLRKSRNLRLHTVGRMISCGRFTPQSIHTTVVLWIAVSVESPDRLQLQYYTQPMEPCAAAAVAHLLPGW
jgi:hypothetical protein